MYTWDIYGLLTQCPGVLGPDECYASTNFRADSSGSMLHHCTAFQCKELLGVSVRGLRNYTRSLQLFIAWDCRNCQGIVVILVSVQGLRGTVQEVLVY